MVSCPEHDNCIPGAPHDGGCVESRNGYLISGPCLLHRCDEQVLKKSSSSLAVATSDLYFRGASRRSTVIRRLVKSMQCNGDEMEVNEKAVL
ncbi:Os01g0116100 [Oryza sativa Japonica Group]|jgi:hypothetical protein|uniref:Os01g0116100 protein n=2 Tax=Oryza sativa subsp. japonica TaxID=39947 RepID=C7IWM6_ORYSJ|nr:hypothetical protein EE612_004275 [Oryza sativa]BAH90872.1 Os01g0116100 [Oryza sativa Japonica Group]BAS70078.1 Os01g0116100 [Oryza sativa Japonica Group]|eukprot:NP_001172142.1 Os01g0116100 [Oryza sativa Japonica Group]